MGRKHVGADRDAGNRRSSSDIDAGCDSTRAMHCAWLRRRVGLQHRLRRRGRQQRCDGRFRQRTLSAIAALIGTDAELISLKPPNVAVLTHAKLVQRGDENRVPTTPSGGLSAFGRLLGIFVWMSIVSRFRLLISQVPWPGITPWESCPSTTATASRW